VAKIPPKTGPKIVVFGSPGRGVLRFWTGGIQESRSDFSQKRPKNQKIDRFRGWCNTTPIRPDFRDRIPGVWGRCLFSSLLI